MALAIAALEFLKEALKNPHSLCYLAVFAAVLSMIMASTGYHPLEGSHPVPQAQASEVKK